MRFDGGPSIGPLAFFLALFVLIGLTMVYDSALGYPPPVGVWASLSIVGFLLAFVAFAHVKFRRAVKSGVWDLGIKPEPRKWWQYTPERPWPLWIRLLNLALIGASTYAWVVLGGAPRVPRRALGAFRGRPSVVCVAAAWVEGSAGTANALGTQVSSEWVG